MAPPVGIPLGEEHAVGKQIGKGAFGQVHAVVLRNSKKETKWAVKLTEIPKKTTKKKSTPLERAHLLLWAEQLNYTGHLQQLCGTVIPRIPLVKDGLQAFYHDTQGKQKQSEAGSQQCVKFCRFARSLAARTASLAQLFISQSIPFSIVLPADTQATASWSWSAWRNRCLKRSEISWRRAPPAAAAV